MHKGIPTHEKDCVFKLYTNYGFSGTCVIIHLPYLKHMLSNINDEQLHKWCHFMTIDIQVRVLVYWHEYVQHRYAIYVHMLHNGLQVS